MSLKERVYSVLVVSTGEKLNAALRSMLPEARYDPVLFVSSLSAARRHIGAHAFDHVIINSPLPDGDGSRFAMDVSSAPGSVVLLLIRAEQLPDLSAKVVECGVFTLSKPLNRTLLTVCLSWMSSARERLRRLEKKTVSFEEKMEEIRLVNRAKWLLISERGMDEPTAHRYIEKQAMDRCVPKRQVAEEILKAYL